jgi:hypothetical protein
VLPEGFYATTNLPTEVRVGGRWVEVARPEMDCALVLASADGVDRSRAVPMHRVHAGDLVVVGRAGLRVRPWRPRWRSTASTSIRPW